MRSAGKFRGQGLGKQLLEYILNVARQRNYQYLRLETGCEDFFEPARGIYQRYGFVVRSPFANYTDDPNSVFMEKSLTV
jgi:putative acetyltransferase